MRVSNYHRWYNRLLAPSDYAYNADLISGLFVVKDIGTLRGG
jgi:hypothetical protein